DHGGGGGGDVGRDAAGVDDGDLDGVAGERHVGAHRLGEAAHGELRGAVRGHAGLCEIAIEATDIDQVAVTGRDQVGQEGLGAVDDAPQVDAQQALERA